MHEVSARSRRSLWAWALWALFGTGLLFASNATAQEDPAEPGAVAGDAARGGELYAVHCARCHAADGSGATVPGTEVQAPSLRGEDGMTLQYVDLTLRTGRMPPPENNPFDNRHRNPIFDDSDREALLAFVSQEYGVEGEIPVVGEGVAGRGLELFAANCAQCHGATGQGGVAGAGAWTPRVAGYDPVVIAEAIRVGPFQMPRFESEQIGDEGLADIAAFLDEAAEEQGTMLGLTELNPVYASGFVALLALLMALSIMWVSGRPKWFPDPEPSHEEDQA